MNNDNRTTVRIPPDLKEKIAADAKAQDRSMHYIILKILREYYENKK